MRLFNPGILSGLGAFGLWGILPVFWKLLEDVPAYEIIAHRTLWSAVTMLLIVGLRGNLIGTLRGAKSWKIFMLTAALVSGNWFVFIWAVNSGFILETSLGYYINPLISVLFGVLLLGERLRTAQLWALLLATLGVGYLTFGYGEIPWIALFLAVSFGLYALLRKTATIGALDGLLIETLLLFLPALVFIGFLEYAQQGSFLGATPLKMLLLILTGPVTAIPLLLFAHAARNLTLSTIGIMQYLSPSISFLLAVFVYSEKFTSAHFISFACIWTALAIYTIDGYRRKEVRTE